ncbi:MAG: nitroreductase family deazaflavin-dependent oxidoreductase [Anaerolineae bacterium]|nr:nitroreductase family deazaflavin-dependent oxidoreductase [Anaerolineae bacterium]
MAQAEQHPRWNWKPPVWMNATITGLLKLPVLHKLVSKNILLITFTGRKSGQQFTTPIAYVREGRDSVLILIKRFRPWWHNFEEPAPVTLRLEGKKVPATARVITDQDLAVRLLAAYLTGQPRSADAYGVEIGPSGEPNMGDVQALAPKIVIVRITVK